MFPRPATMESTHSDDKAAETGDTCGDYVGTSLTHDKPIIHKALHLIVSNHKIKGNRKVDVCKTF